MYPKPTSSAMIWYRSPTKWTRTATSGRWINPGSGWRSTRSFWRNILPLRDLATYENTFLVSARIFLFGNSSPELPQQTHTLGRTLYGRRHHRHRHARGDAED